MKRSVAKLLESDGRAIYWFWFFFNFMCVFLRVIELVSL